jgi:hypothetical protein
MAHCAKTTAFPSELRQACFSTKTVKVHQQKQLKGNSCGPVLRFNVQMLSNFLDEIFCRAVAWHTGIREQNVI